MMYDERSVGDGLKLDSNRLLALALSSTGGLEFASGELKIKYPADGAVKTSAVGLEVDISGMAAQATPAEGDLFVVEDTGGTDAKEKTTLAELRDAIINPPADGAIKNTTNVFEVDISGMAAQATPAEADLFLVEDSGGSDAKEKTTLAELRDAVINPPADGAIKNTTNVFEVDISGMRAWGTPGPQSTSDYLLIEEVGVGDEKLKETTGDFRLWTHEQRGLTTITASATLNPETTSILLCNHATVAITVTLPANGASRIGYVAHIKNINQATVTITPNVADGTQEIDDNDGSPYTLAYRESLTVVSDGTEWWII
jgi:hypothetical protein